MSKYNKGDKFIIELDEQMGNLWRVKGFSTLVFDDFGLDRLGQLVQGVDQYSRMKGQQEAWELAQRFVNGPHVGGLTTAQVREIFDEGIYGAIANTTYAEAAAKVEAWEKEKEIQVGDVVKHRNGMPGCVWGMSGKLVRGVTSDMQTFSWFKSDCTKTGRHIDIEAVLDQIK